MSRTRTLEILLSPTTRCNLRCRYCYVDQSLSVKETDLSISDIKDIYRWLASYAKIIDVDRIRFTWFGGEPLLPGVRFLDTALRLQREHFSSFEIINSMQSNLTLLDDGLIPLLKTYFHSSISASIDFGGDCRVFSNGKDSTTVVERNIVNLVSAGISVGAVCTLTRRNLGKCTEIYAYFKRLGTAFRVNRAAGIQLSENELITVAEYNEAVKSLFDIYLSDPSPTVEFFNFTTMARLFLLGQSTVCVDTEKPFLYLGFEAQGRITSRCRFTDPLGNYRTDTPEDFYRKCLRSATPHATPSRCTNCEFFERTCQGGCFGEKGLDCYDSDCGYRTETTQVLWRYVQGYLQKQGLHLGEAANKK